MIKLKLKTEKEIAVLREGGRRLAKILREVARQAKPGALTKELDQLAYDLIKANGDEPAFLNYMPGGSLIPYPATLCVSINNEIVHGLPSPRRRLKEGDIVGLDLGLRHGGLFTDMAVTVAIGEVSGL